MWVCACKEVEFKFQIDSAQVNRQKFQFGSVQPVHTHTHSPSLRLSISICWNDLCLNWMLSTPFLVVVVLFFPCLGLPRLGLHLLWARTHFRLVLDTHADRQTVHRSNFMSHARADINFLNKIYIHLHLEATDRPGRRRRRERRPRRPHERLAKPEGMSTHTHTTGVCKFCSVLSCFFSLRLFVLVFFFILFRSLCVWMSATQSDEVKSIFDCIYSFFLFHSSCTIPGATCLGATHNKQQHLCLAIRKISNFHHPKNIEHGHWQDGGVRRGGR